MKLDIFSEIQKRDCDANGGFGKLLDESIEQARVADEAGFDCWWEVEHHCTPDFSYSSCPELILEAIALNTKRLRIGHAGVLVPFEINHPLRAAERAAMLDHLSGGRLEMGLAKSGGKEWETFGISERQAADDLVEATQMLPRAWSDAAFSWDSGRWKVAERTVLPKPKQRPHPPLWHTCSSPPSFERAGQLGVGVLGTTLFAPVDALDGMIKGYRKRHRATRRARRPLRQRQRRCVHLRARCRIDARGDRERGAALGIVVRQFRAARVQRAARHLLRQHPRQHRSALRGRRRTRRYGRGKARPECRSTIRTRSSRC